MGSSLGHDGCGAGLGFSRPIHLSQGRMTLSPHSRHREGKVAGRLVILMAPSRSAGAPSLRSVARDHSRNPPYKEGDQGQENQGTPKVEAGHHHHDQNGRRQDDGEGREAQLPQTVPIHITVTWFRLG